METGTVEQRITRAVLKREAAEQMADNPLKQALLLEARLSILAAKNDRAFAISQRFQKMVRHDPAWALVWRALAQAGL